MIRKDTTMADQVEVTNFDALPLAFEAHKVSLLPAPDQIVKDAIESFKLTAKQLEALPAV